MTFGITLAGALRDDLAEAVRESRLDPRFSGLADYRPEDLRALAAEALRVSGSVWRMNGTDLTSNSKEKGAEADPEDIVQLAGRLAGFYEIYREYLKLEVKSFVFEWSRENGRFRVKKKILMDPRPSFLDFMITDGYLFRVAC